MNRRLNPELFNTSAEPRPPGPSPTSMLATQKVQKDLVGLRKQVSHLESLLEVQQSQIERINEGHEKRVDVISRAIGSLEKDFREQSLLQSRQIQKLEAQIRDSRVVEGQVESLVERFNTNLSQFENRLSALKKILSEKDMTLMSYRRVIEQIVDEVEKLKKTSNRPQRPSY